MTYIDRMITTDAENVPPVWCFSMKKNEFNSISSFTFFQI